MKKQEKVLKQIESIMDKIHSICQKNGIDFAVYLRKDEMTYVDASRPDERLLKESMLALGQLRSKVLEMARFEEVLSLPNFRAVFKNASNPPYEPFTHNWPEQGKVYLVTKVIRSLNSLGYAFEIEDLNGNKIIPSEPYNGFDSQRFIVDDYGSLN